MNCGNKLIVAVILTATVGWSAAVAQTVETKQVMRRKLAQAQQLLEALATSNWSQLEQHGRALEALTKEPGWAVLRSPEYIKQTEAFQRALTTLIQSAGMRDPDISLRAYNGLIASCVQCHRQVARSRVVTIPHRR
jgi:hypothetical protein